VEQPETPRDMARRYIAEGEERCAELTRLLEQAETHDPPHAIEEFERLLAVLDRALSLLREHLKQELAVEKKGGPAV
jgi:transcription elongation GreA/GreB family factor